MRRKDKVAVLGLWHLGSVTSACLADLGYQVTGFDPDRQRVDQLNHGKPPLYEPGLQELIKKCLSADNISYTTDLKIALHEARYIIISFDTPINDKDEADLSPIDDAVSQSVQYLEDDCIIIVSSQVPIGSCERFASTITKARPDLGFGIAYVPENLQLGEAIERFRHPDMIVIGSNHANTLDMVERFYSVIHAPKMRVDLRTAEMVKHAINTYLAMQISFINEIANLSDGLHANGLKVSEAMRLDRRIGPKARLQPGLGFAGGTLARDLKVLQKLGRGVGCETHLVDSILKVNERQNRMVVTKLHKIYGTIDGLTVGVLGLTYKPGTSTLRRSASLEVIRELIEEGAKVKAFDPKANIHEAQHPVAFEICSDPLSVAKGADALVLMTAWPEFSEINFCTIKSLMTKPVIIDAQNMLDCEKLLNLGFTYLGMGRGNGASVEGRKG